MSDGRSDVAVVFDHTALLALGSGSRLASQLVVAAHGRAGRHVYAPAMCLAAAVAERPALADHVGALEAIEVVDLGYAAAGNVGRMIASGADWRDAQAVHTARPSAEWLAGLPVVTAQPEVYQPYRLKTIPLG
jgi:hypothetical protein